MVVGGGGVPGGGWWEVDGRVYIALAWSKYYIPIELAVGKTVMRIALDSVCRYGGHVHNA